jgi:hypothetical protein
MGANGFRMALSFLLFAEAGTFGLIFLLNAGFQRLSAITGEKSVSPGKSSQYENARRTAIR